MDIDISDRSPTQLRRTNSSERSASLLALSIGSSDITITFSKKLSVAPRAEAKSRSASDYLPSSIACETTGDNDCILLCSVDSSSVVNRSFDI